MAGLSWKELVTLAGGQINAGKILQQAYFKGKETNAVVSLCYLIHDTLYPVSPSVSLAKSSQKDNLGLWAFV